MRVSLPPALVEVERLSVSYRVLEKNSRKWIRQHVIQNVTFKITPGETAVLLGTNGSGKSTILHTIAGLMDPNEGIIQIDGRPPVCGEIGLIFQDYLLTLLPWRTIFGNLSLPLEIKKMDRDSIRRKVNDILTELDLKFDLNAYPYQLSGGQQQLLSIARTLIGSPRFLMLDEPFSALDFENRTAMREKVLRIIETSGITALVVTHDTLDALLLGDRVFVLRAGCIAATSVIPLSRPRALSMLDSSVAINTARQLEGYLA